jgi:hypothetical protein
MKKIILAITLTLACSAAAQEDPNDPYNPENPFRRPGIITERTDGTVDRDGTIIGQIQTDPATGERRFVPRPR